MRALKIEEATDCSLVESLYRLEHLCFGETAWSKDLLAVSLTSAVKHVYIIHEQQRMLGYMIIQIILDEGEIERIGIHPDFRRQSLGKHLLMNVLEQNTIADCFLEVNAMNVSAKKLYHSCGFEIIGCREKYYQDGNDALMMKWKRNFNE